MIGMIKKFILFLFSLCCLQIAFAHGSMETPLSRLYNCYKEGPENPRSAACRAAVAAGGTQALYDWNGLNQAAANDRHREIIPDGKICSAGRDLFKGMDLARNDWVTTTIMPDKNNQFQFVYLATAPHATRYIRLYITKDSYDFSQPLKWSDFVDQPFCTITSVTLENSRYKLNCPFPPGSGKHVIFTIWQRSDSTEAFYACNDVVLSNNPTPPPQANWKELTTLFAQSSVTADTKVKFRLFKNGSEAVTTTVQITAAQTQASQWPYYLAQAVNAQSTLAHIGQLNTQGEVVPVMSANLNKIYVNDADISPYTHSIDFIAPSDDFEYVYPDGIANYKAGTVVLGFDQRRYKCKPFPASGWCSQSPVYYEPGRGLSWQQAWDVVS